MPNPLISVIVPIYNVAPYLRKSLDSLKGQTLKHIEVICINDGSTDGSGEIAEEYKNEGGWPRFRVIHTENRGLSAARNRGIDEAQAEWIMFVDSDDWVDERFCEIPYKTAVRENADLVVFQYFIVKHGRARNPKKKNIKAGVIDEMVAYEYAGPFAWNKLYKKVLFESIRYPEGRVYEDVYTTHKLIHKATKIFILNNRLYYHVKRKGSITQTHTTVNKRDGFVAGIERQEDLTSYGYPAERVSICGPAIGFLSVSTPSDDPLYLKAVEMVDLVQGYPKGLTLKQKMGLTVWRVNRSLFYFICRELGRVQ